jgi:hypothetical protein
MFSFLADLRLVQSGLKASQRVKLRSSYGFA